MERDYRYPFPSGDSLSTIAANINASRPHYSGEEYTPRLSRPAKKFSLRSFIYSKFYLPFMWATRHDYKYEFSRDGESWYTVHSQYWFPMTLKKAIAHSKADPYNGVAAGCQFRNFVRTKGI
jgi:hypothetical protein